MRKSLIQNSSLITRKKCTKIVSFMFRLLGGREQYRYSAVVSKRSKGHYKRIHIFLVRDELVSQKVWAEGWLLQDVCWQIFTVIWQKLQSSISRDCMMWLNGSLNQPLVVHAMPMYENMALICSLCNFFMTGLELWRQL